MVVVVGLVVVVVAIEDESSRVPARVMPTMPQLSRVRIRSLSLWSPGLGTVLVPI